MEPSSRKLDRLENPDPEFFKQEYLHKNRPCIITGVADKWKAMRWTPEFFKQSFAGADIRYEIWDGDDEVNDPLDFQSKQTYVDTSMGEFIDKMLDAKEPSRKYYCAQFQLFDVLPQLRKEFGSMEEFMGFPPFLPKKVRDLLKISPFLWLGPAGVLSMLHFDRAHNIFVQIHGRKKWIHIPPEHSNYVYYPCAGFSSSLFHFSPVDVEHPDLERFPLYAKAEPIETIVEPGEMVFTPAGWWHYVRALDASISMNFFWLLPLENAIALRKYLYLFGRRKLLTAVGMKNVLDKLEVPAPART
jgi:hypothetical protein